MDWPAAYTPNNGPMDAFVLVQTKGKAGMGIGVYEVRDYVHKLGGDIEVISRVGEGTTFRVRLPISDAA